MSSLITDSKALTLCNQRGWFVEKGTKRQQCSHYLLDGFGTGNLFVPVSGLPALMEAMLEDIEFKRHIFFVELPRDNMGSLVLDVDFKRFRPTVAEAMAFGQVIIELVMDCIDWELLLSAAEPDDSLKGLEACALISMCDEGPNMHIAFPSCRLSQDSAVRLLCTLPELVYRRRQSIKGFESVSRPELETILDMCVVTCNGVRMNGSYKCTAGGTDTHPHGQGEKRVYRPQKLYLHDLGETKKHRMLNNLHSKFSRMRLHQFSSINSSPFKGVAHLKLDIIKKAALNEGRYKREMSKLAASEAREVSESGHALSMLGAAGVKALDLALVKLGYDRPPRIADVMLVTKVGCGYEFQILFDRKDELSRKCFNYGKTHKSNPTFCVLDVATMELSQRCRCPCRDKSGLKTPCQDYISAPVGVDIAPDSLPAIVRTRTAASREKAVPHIDSADPTVDASDILVHAAIRDEKSKKKKYATWNFMAQSTKRKLEEEESKPYDPLRPIMASGLTYPIEASGMRRHSRNQLCIENRPKNRMGVRAIISSKCVDLELVIPPTHPDFKQLGGAITIAHYERLIVNPNTLLPPLQHKEEIEGDGERGVGEQMPEGVR
jgi:hypothetical protein